MQYDCDYYFNCSFTVTIDDVAVTVTHMRITSDTVMLQHNANCNLYNNIQLLQALQTLFNISFTYNDNWDDSNFVELVRNEV